MSGPENPQPDAEKAGPSAAHLAHQFASPEQQFAAGKLGMWIFLLTEILLFGGMFCAYAVFRANRPEIFFYAEQFLDRTLGAINTGILITSSLTMAWAVHCAQRDQQRGLIVCLALTLLFASGFLGIKYVEYRHKWEAGLLWAGAYKPDERAADQTEGHDPAAPPVAAADQQARKNAGIFFSVYFMMTGLHALHVIGGMAAIACILVLAAKGRFGSRYFGPVDYVGLYWHLVDMIWIYLFPLLYLIH
jgi:cytochrome c oxidase subunit 3